MVIVEFTGGLGNQIFQYAFYKKHKVLGKKVGADLSFYSGKNKNMFALESAFSNIHLNTQDVEQQKLNLQKEYEERSALKRVFHAFFRNISS